MGASQLQGQQAARRDAGLHAFTQPSWPKPRGHTQSKEDKGPGGDPLPQCCLETRAQGTWAGSSDPTCCGGLLRRPVTHPLDELLPRPQPAASAAPPPQGQGSALGKCPRGHRLPTERRLGEGSRPRRGRKDTLNNRRAGGRDIFKSPPAQASTFSPVINLKRRERRDTQGRGLGRPAPTLLARTPGPAPCPGRLPHRVSLLPRCPPR